MPGPAEVSWSELAQDCEAFVGQAHPASPDHRLRGTRLPLGERGQVQREAAGLVQRHLVAGTLLCGVGRCPPPPPLGGRMCAGLLARTFFAARHEVMLQLRLATHCRDTWVRRLWTPARIWRPLGDHFLMDYYPHPLEGGAPLLPYARRPPRAPPKSVPPAAPQRSRPPVAGSGTQGALCLEHGAPSCPRCRSLGWGISCGCCAGHEGHGGSAAGPQCPVAPPRVPPGRQVLVPEDRRAGAAALSSWLGRARPASQALPASGPPAARRCTPPPTPPLWPQDPGTSDPRSAPNLTPWLTRGGL